MEFAAGALGAIASGIGSVASASATLLPAIGGVSSLAFSVLSGGATVASMLQHQRAGEQQARSLELQALDAEGNVGIEEVRGLERRNSIKQSLVAALGERDVAAAASGVDLSFGTPVIARREAIEEGERALTLDRQTENLRVARLRERAASYRQLASEARAGGLARASIAALEGGARIAGRYA